MIPRELDVLLIQRDATLASALSANLQKRGHYVRVAESAVEALDLPRPDALITDEDAGGLTAAELIRHYANTGPLPRTVVISERPSLAACRDAMRLGAADYIAAPFRLDELFRAIESPDPLATVEPSGTTMSLELTAEADSVARAGRELAAFCTRNGLGPSTRARVVSAALECVENATRYAYPGIGGAIEVEAHLDDRDCHVRIVDQGVGVSAGERTDDGEDDVAPGFARAAACAEELRVLSAPGAGTTVELRFRAYRVDFDEAGTIDLSEYDYFTPDTAREVLRTLAVEECGELFTLSPSLALLVGRLLAGPRAMDGVTTRSTC